MENQPISNLEKIKKSDYKMQYAMHHDRYLNSIAFAFETWALFVSPHVFDHVSSNLAKYKSGILSEKIKHSRGLNPNFSVKNRKQQKELNKKYLWLDPEKIPLHIIDFFKNWEFRKKKYNPEETLLLKSWLIDNHNEVKDMLFNYDSLIIPTEEWYSDLESERVVKLKKDWDFFGYLLSKNIPIRYSEKHLRKYRWNDFAFEVFDKKDALMAYLRNELSYIKFQKDRFNELIKYFTVMDLSWENLENIERAYIWFGFWKTYSDQYIKEKLEQLLSWEKRWRKQIIEALVSQVQKALKESEEKFSILNEYYSAISKNNLF